MNGLKLFYEESHFKRCQELGDQRFLWLADLDAAPLTEAGTQEEGFVFSLDGGTEAYAQMLKPYSRMHERPEIRQQIDDMERVLPTLTKSVPDLPAARTWQIGIDDTLPSDLTFPLFVRASRHSWKRGGEISRVRTERELVDEMSLLRRAYGWNSTILARQWLDLAPAGEHRGRMLPQEVRVWIVNGSPSVWSFHHCHLIPTPTGFPPSRQDLELLADYARQIAKVFQARLIVADFARLRAGGWTFIELGPGGVAGTGHEAVFKTVAMSMMGQSPAAFSDRIGGTFER